MTDYSVLLSQMRSLAEGNHPWFTDLSNAAALLFDTLPDLNWAGFYLMHNGRLCLGPFCGKPACTEIEVGRGVCGTAVRECAIQRVADVHAFPGHIACDSASASEIVLPLFDSDGRVTGVLDIDSPVKDRFSSEDEAGLAAFAELAEPWAAAACR